MWSYKQVKNHFEVYYESSLLNFSGMMDFTFIDKNKIIIDFFLHIHQYFFLGIHYKGFHPCFIQEEDW